MKYYAAEKKISYLFKNRMDRTGEYYAGSKRQIPYDLTYDMNLMNKTNKQNTTRDMEIKNKLTVTSGGQWGEEGEMLSRNMCQGPMDKDNGVGEED